MAIVEDFENLATEIIKEAAAYAGSQESNEAIAGAIRQLRTVAAAVMTALDTASQAQRRAPFIPSPPTPDTLAMPAPMASRLAPSPKVN